MEYCWCVIGSVVILETFDVGKLFGSNSSLELVFRTFEVNSFVKITQERKSDDRSSQKKVSQQKPQAGIEAFRKI